MGFSYERDNPVHEGFLSLLEDKKSASLSSSSSSSSWCALILMETGQLTHYATISTESEQTLPRIGSLPFLDQRQIQNWWISESYDFLSNAFRGAHSTFLRRRAIAFCRDSGINLVRISRINLRRIRTGAPQTPLALLPSGRIGPPRDSPRDG